jgi:DinB superfamily
MGVINAEERQYLVNLLEGSMSKFERSIANLGENQLNFRPKQGKWTIAECIEHITLTEQSFPKIVETELAKPAEPSRRSEIKISNESIRKRLNFRLFKANSPEKWQPTHQFGTTETALTLLRGQRQATIAYIKTTEDDLRHHFWRHMATGVVDLYQTLIVLSAHLERHTKQIEAIKSARRFPKNAV